MLFGILPANVPVEPAYIQLCHGQKRNFIKLPSLFFIGYFIFLRSFHRLCFSVYPHGHNAETRVITGNFR